MLRVRVRVRVPVCSSGAMLRVRLRVRGRVPVRNSGAMLRVLGYQCVAHGQCLGLGSGLAVAVKGILSFAVWLGLPSGTAACSLSGTAACSLSGTAACSLTSGALRFVLCSASPLHGKCRSPHR